MTQTAWDAGGDVRTALRLITGDPQLGAGVLAAPHVLANVLKVLLPDLPRESALLVAAAQCDLPGMLCGHLEAGLDLGTSSRLTACWFAERMPFTDDACGWVVAELAIALGADPVALADGTLPEAAPARPGDFFGPGGLASHNGQGRPDQARGAVVAWGDNDEGEIDVPERLYGVTAVAAGWFHSLAVTGPGRVVAWGSRADGMTDVPAGLAGRSRPARSTAWP
ncbi:MAG: hypothetical protein ACR2FU_15420 [Streptosporangiaceae bacterium]